MVVEQDYIKNNINDKYFEHKKWALLESGKVLALYWDVKDENGYIWDDYRTIYRDKDNNALAMYGEIERGEKHYIHKTCSEIIIAEGDTKQEIIEYKRAKGIKQKRKHTKKQIDKWIESLLELNKKRREQNEQNYLSGKHNKRNRE